MVVVVMCHIFYSKILGITLLNKMLVSKKRKAEGSLSSQFVQRQQHSYLILVLDNGQRISKSVWIWKKEYGEFLDSLIAQKYCLVKLNKKLI